MDTLFFTAFLVCFPVNVNLGIFQVCNSHVFIHLITISEIHDVYYNLLWLKQKMSCLTNFDFMFFLVFIKM